VSWPQTVAAGLLVVLLVAVAGYFLGRHVQVLRDLRRYPPPPDEARHLRRQGYLRLVTSALLLLLGFLLATAQLYLESPAQQLADERAAQEAAGEKADFTDAQRDFGRLYGGFWIGFLLILMVIVFLAAADLWATRRHALNEHRRIQADRRAMLEQQISRMRNERRGDGYTPG
jgi:hypothetical protein